MAKTPRKSDVSAPHLIAPVQLLGDIRTVIETRRNQAAQAINAELVLMYWQIGDRIRREILQEA